MPWGGHSTGTFLAQFILNRDASPSRPTFFRTLVSPSKGSVAEWLGQYPCSAGLWAQVGNSVAHCTFPLVSGTLSFVMPLGIPQSPLGIPGEWVSVALPSLCQKAGDKDFTF